MRAWLTSGFAGKPGLSMSAAAIPVASLDHMIAMKEATGRRKDELMATEYRELADEQRRQS
jgi:hypothetical protein